MIAERRRDLDESLALTSVELAHDIITVVRERVLREIETYARENIR